MRNRKTLLIIALALIAALLFAFASCKRAEDKTIWKDAIYKEDAVIGEGSATFTLTVKAVGKSVTLTVSTDKLSLADALLELSLLEGKEGDYGLYMEKVNGMVADYDTDGTYWALYEDGKYAMTGISFTEVRDGGNYGLYKEKG